MKKIYFLSVLFFILLVSSCKEEDPCKANPNLCVQEQFDEDVIKIEQFIEDNNLEATRHPSGLYYQADNPGVGDTVTTGQFVSVDYIGRLLDGTIFDTSIDSVARAEGIFNENRTYQPYTFQVGTGRVIQGWDIGLTLFEEGGTGYLIIPSYLGYGTNSSANIPANSVLYFEINLIDVKY